MAESIDSTRLHYHAEYKVRITTATIVSCIALAIIGLGLLAQYKQISLDQKTIQILLISGGVATVSSLIFLCAFCTQRSVKIDRALIAFDREKSESILRATRMPSVSVVGTSTNETPEAIEREKQRLSKGGSLKKPLKTPLETPPAN